jgi:hypothetical protein
MRTSKKQGHGLKAPAGKAASTNFPRRKRYRARK